MSQNTDALVQLEKECRLHELNGERFAPSFRAAIELAKQTNRTPVAPVAEREAFERGNLGYKDGSLGWIFPNGHFRTLNDMEVDSINRIMDNGTHANMLARPVFAFLLGEGQLEGRGFGDEPPPHPSGRKAPYWWRKHLRAALSQAQPVKLPNEEEIVKALQPFTYESDKFSIIMAGHNEALEEIARSIIALIEQKAGA